MNLLETKALGHSFGDFRVLSHVSLQIRNGERHAIIGPNGAGKTTLFNLMTGRYKPSEGQVFFKGRNVTKAKPYEMFRLGVGRSFQITSTFQKLTVFENVRMAVMSQKGYRYNLFRNAAKLHTIVEKTDAIIRQIDLEAQRDVPASMLSYGQHRCLEVGLAIAHGPELIMLDEPSAGMSRDETHALVELIRRLTEDKTMVIVEHDMDVVFSLSDRITVLHHGTILATDTPDRIKDSQAVKDAYLGNARTPDAA